MKPILINTNNTFFLSASMRFMLRSVRFEIPDLWKDESLYFYKYNIQGSPITLVVSSDIVNQGESSDNYVDRQLDILSKRLSSFNLLKKELVSASGKVKIYDLGFTWQSRLGFIRQLQRYVISTNQVLAFTISTKKDDFAKFQSMIDGIVAKIGVVAS